MNKIPRSLQSSRILLYMLSFFLPFFVMVLGLIAMHVTPFGKHNLAILDGQYYINGALSFGRLLRGGENWFYSFSGLGSNEWAGLSWGGLSFGRLLSVFGTLENMPTLFTWICLINISICGLTMYVMLADINKDKPGNLLFSSTYALIGFNVVNCYQTLFFMGPQMLPLMVMGLYRLLNGRSPLIYIISLSLCIFTDFYFGFHLCVFSAIYFCAYCFVGKDELNGRHTTMFGEWAASSVIAGLLGAPMWLPALKEFSGGGRLNQTKISEYTFDDKMPFIQIFTKLFSGANSYNEIVNGLPLIFCGILVVALVILYFMNEKIDSRKKRTAGIIIAFYLLTFYIPVLTLLMHGGTHTNWFPYRYSYVFSFILICLAAEEFRFIDDIHMEDTVKCGKILLISTILVFSTKFDYINGGSVVLDLALLFLMWLGFWLYRTKPDKADIKTLSIFLTLIVCVNLYANFIISINRMQEYELDIDKYNANIMKSGALVDAINMSDESFFRMEKGKSESETVGADPVLYDYNGVSGSGPTIRAFINEELNRLGVNWFDMRHWYSEGIPAATDSLLGLKYLISENDLEAEKGYEQLVEMDGTSVFRNNDAPGIAILSYDDVGKIKLGKDPFHNLNRIWSSMTGGKDRIFTEEENVTFTLRNTTTEESVTTKELKEERKKKESISASATTPSGSGSVEKSASSGSDVDDEDETVQSYFEYSFTAAKDGPVYCSDTSMPSSEAGRITPSIKCCGVYKAGDKVTGKFKINGSDYGTREMLHDYCMNQVFAYADDDVLKEHEKLLNSRDIVTNVEAQNHLSGSFTADKDMRILFTFPWDEGWTCYIDGEKVPIDKTWNLFMSVKVPEGSHTYEMKFVPAWLDYGLMLADIALAGLIVLMIWYKRSSRHKEEAAVQEESGEQE